MKSNETTMSGSRKRLTLAIAAWFVLAFSAAITAMGLIGEHGSIVYLMFAIPIAVCGSSGSALSYSVVRVRNAHPLARFAIVSAFATAPIVVFTIYGLLSDPTYGARDAVFFFTRFVLPGIGLAGIAEIILHAGSRQNSSAVNSPNIDHLRSENGPPRQSHAPGASG